MFPATYENRFYRKKNETLIADISADGIIINNTQDALDMMMNCSYQGADKIIWYEQNITPEFFDLKTKLAGNILQKFSTYNMELAIIGEFSKYNSKSLKDFIFESNKQRKINFLATKEEALAILSANKRSI
ncbi:DUF4180 domain-containing protein [Pseudopedobacter saltans]|uniref:DUF4180 domain-containing protein n=1 Tax=Pseudopedobacter saltans TaxID=151895 RepID=UPI00059F2FCB|nr:DUF4180 domain-containing protein [Pseudopedobacter saltans]